MSIVTSEYLQYLFTGVLSLTLATIGACVKWRPKLHPKLDVESEIRTRLSSFLDECITQSLDNTDSRGRITGILYEWGRGYNCQDRVLVYEDAEEPFEKIIHEVRTISSRSIPQSLSELHQRRLVEFINARLSARERDILLFRRANFLWFMMLLGSIALLIVAVVGSVVSEEVLGSAFHIEYDGLIAEDTMFQLMTFLLIVSLLFFIGSVFALRPGDTRGGQE